jgi:hypothetical protein
MANRTLRTQRVLKPATLLKSGDLFLTRQGTETEDSVAVMSDLMTLTGPHPRYHFHGYAGDIISGDGKFFDLSPLGNHAVRGANLSEANMLANAGYVSTVDPAGGATDSVLRMPNLNFYHAGGEKLILYWLGKATPEGTDQPLIGDGGSATYPGFRVICKTTGVIQLGMYDSGGGSDFSGTSSGVPFDGTLHSIGVVIDGAAKKYAFWVDEALDASMSGAYGNFALSGRDTRNSNTFNIGQGSPAAAASTFGMVVQTRSLHALRLSATDTIPSIATLTNVFKQLRVNPSKPILGGAF